MAGTQAASATVLAVKIAMVGSIGVGKTSLAQRLCRGDIDSNTKATIAGDWFHHSLTVRNCRVNLQIWDTAGQEKFRSVIPSYIRASATVLIVYDVSDVRSFTDRSMWLKMVRNVVPTAVIILVANKVDKQNRMISTEEGEMFASQNGLLYTETSAATGDNVQPLFQNIAESAFSKWRIEESADSENIKLDSFVDRENISRKKCAC